MRTARWVISGIAGATLFVAGASVPVGDTKDEQYYRRAFVFSEWPADFHPDLALTLTCSAGKVRLHPVSLAATPPKKLAKMPANMLKTMLYPTVCAAYFTSSSNPALPSQGQAFAAVVFDKNGRLAQGAGGAGSAEMQESFSWLLLKEGYTAYIQLDKHSKASGWSPNNEGQVNFPNLPGN